MYIGEFGKTSTFRTIRRGVAGVRQSVAEIRNQITKGSRSLLVRRVAEEAIRNVPAKDYLGELQAIHDWVASHARFTRDPDQTERFVEAETTVQGILTNGTAFLDCDDYSILIGSMLKSVGFPVRVNTVGIKSVPHHVYVSALALGRWYGLDPAARAHPAKWGWRELSYV